MTHIKNRIERTFSHELTNSRIALILITHFVHPGVINTFHWIPDIKGHTPLLNLIILLESAVPTAQNVVMLLLVHGRMEKGEALAQIVLLQMAISIITFTVSCSFFQWLVIPTV